MTYLMFTGNQDHQQEEGSRVQFPPIVSIVWNDRVFDRHAP